MTLPCRNHQPRSHSGSLPLPLLFAAFFLVLQPGRSWSQDTVGSTFEQAGLGWLPAIPIQINAGLDAGYDDNVGLSFRLVSQRHTGGYIQPGRHGRFAGDDPRKAGSRG